jgi:hypothetical protein
MSQLTFFKAEEDKKLISLKEVSACKYKGILK